MDIETIKASINDLLSWDSNQFLRVEPEYQRGEVWTNLQKKMFIDSIFRGYPIPAFYLHDKRIEAAGMNSHIRDIVDGQQRKVAISEFHKGEFSLLAPDNESDFRFPNFVKGEPSPWGGKRFEELPENLKKKFLETSLLIYLIKTDEKNKIRDLFIRLQGGTALTPQEKRDSWPGHFTKYVWRLGGKSGMLGYPGFSLFKRAGGKEDDKRQLAAQLAMLYFHREWSDTREFCDIKSKNIDRFYHEHIGFDDSRDVVKNLERAITKVNDLLPLGRYGRPGLLRHEIIHLVLLVDSLLRDDYAPTWEQGLAENFLVFRERCREAVHSNKQNIQSKYARYYEGYSQRVSKESDRKENIQKRNSFFVTEMISLLKAVQKDDKRAYTNTQKEVVYHRDNKKCQVCIFHHGSSPDVNWDEAEIHHVIPHSQGGMTSLENAALVHKHCHPHSAGQVEDFRRWWENRDTGTGFEINPPPPDAFQRLPEDTECRHRRTGVLGKIVVRDGKKKLSIPQRDITQRDIIATSFSGAHKELEGRTANGWVTWDVKFPGTENWQLADDWRKSLPPMPRLTI